MTGQGPFCIRFSDITIKFQPSGPVGVPEEFVSLAWDDVEVPDAQFDIVSLDRPLSPQGSPVYDNRGTLIYQTTEGQLRIYPLRRAEDGSQVACLLRPDGKNVLYYPAALWKHYTDPLHCSHLIGLEEILLRRDAFLLHSAVVGFAGKCVLFSGPSGAGKSTQADLWVRYLDADLLNGDRCVVMERPDGFYGGGSPCAGHSRIYRREQAPIAGIFLVEKAPYNAVRRLGVEAFASLFGQTLINSWDTVFMEKITELFHDLLQQVPVYRLWCRPDKEAVELACSTLFREEGRAGLDVRGEQSCG